MHDVLCVIRVKYVVRTWYGFSVVLKSNNELTEGMCLGNRPNPTYTSLNYLRIDSGTSAKPVKDKARGGER
jgi:hypothetical protein